MSDGTELGKVSAKPSWLEATEARIARVRAKTKAPNEAAGIT
jgi:hypothetical protein